MANKPKETKKEKIERIKSLFEKKLQNLKLRKPLYPGRPFTYHVYYPDRVIHMYKSVGRNVTEINIEDKPGKKRERVGIVLNTPKEEIVQISPKIYLENFSVPLVKIGKVYRSIRDLMKNNGLIISKSQRYNWCWGFSKTRDQITVIFLFYF